MAKQVVDIENRIKEILCVIESSILLPRQKWNISHRYDSKIIGTVVSKLPMLIIGTLGNRRMHLSIANIPNLIDDVSWECVMPNGFTKNDFCQLQNLFNNDIFNKVCDDIDELLDDIDTLDVEERVYCIALLIDSFICHNKYIKDCPDWMGINKQLSDCMGGYCFLNNTEENVVAIPRFVDRGTVTHCCFDYIDDKTVILEVDAQHGLYSLYAAYSLYRDIQDRYSINSGWKTWETVVQEKIKTVCFCNIYADIVRTVLCGKRRKYCNVIVEESYDSMTHNFFEFPHHDVFDDDPRFVAVIGHPRLAQKRQDKVPSWAQAFSFAASIYSHYVCLTFPLLSYLDVVGTSRFELFRRALCDSQMVKISKHLDSADLMSNIDVKDGLGYFLYDNCHTGDCLVSTKWHNYSSVISENLRSKEIFLQFPEAEGIVKKIYASGCDSIERISIGRDPFRWSDLRKKNIIPTPSKVLIDDVLTIGTNTYGYIPRSAITRNIHLLNCFKVATSNNTTQLFSKLIILKPGEICNSGYFVIGSFSTLAEAQNCVSYLQTKLVKFLTLVTVRNHFILRFISHSNLMYVPLEDFNKAPFTDAFLHKKYGLTQAEIDFIDFYLNNFWNTATTNSVKRIRRGRGTYLPNGCFVPETLVPYYLSPVDKTLFNALGKKESRHIQPLCDAIVAELQKAKIDNIDVSLPELFLSDALPYTSSGVDSLWGIMRPLPGEDWRSERLENIRKHLDEKYWRIANGYGEPVLNMGEGSRDIEQLLGIYDYSQRRIIIYERAVQMVARVDGVDADVLRAVVIVHEFGHWLSHIMPYGNSVQWKDNLYIASEDSIHEAWAQLVDFWAIDIAKGKYEIVFNNLLKSQSPLYHVFLYYVSYSADRMLKSLPSLRQLNPALRGDWDKVI